MTRGPRGAIEWDDGGVAEVHPPHDAENWTDDEWIEWLAATDGSGQAEPEVSAPRMARSLGTQMLASMMLGLHEVFYGKPDDQQVQVAPSPDPHDEDDEMKISLDPDVPSNSEVRIRP